MIRDIKIDAIIEKKQWVPFGMHVRRRLIRAAGWVMRGLQQAIHVVAPKWEPALGALASSVGSLPGGGGPTIQAEQKFLHIIGTFVLTGSYPGAPGDTFDVTLATLPPGYTINSLGPIIMGWAQSIKAAGASGFSYTIIPGTTIRNGTLDVQQNGAGNGPNAEISTSAYPSGVLTDTVQFEILVGIQG